MHLCMQRKVCSAVLHRDQVCNKEKVRQGLGSNGRPPWLSPSSSHPWWSSLLQVPEDQDSPITSPDVHVSQRQALCWRVTCGRSQGPCLFVLPPPSICPSPALG